MRVAIYVRVSTDEQAHSAGAQEAGARAWAEARKHTVAAVYRDVGMSGAEWVRRRGLLDLQVDAARTPRPWDILLVRDLDRLGRTVERLDPSLAIVSADLWQRAQSEPDAVRVAAGRSIRRGRRRSIC